jgi:Flp pilus assembly protein TadG
MALELAVVTPVIIVLLLTVVALGRYSHSGIVVEQAAAAAARSASLTSTPGAAAKAARDTAAASLDDAGMSCATLDTAVDTSALRAGGQVQVTVTCHADLSDLALTGVPGSAELASSAAAPLERFRPIGRSR